MFAIWVRTIRWNAVAALLLLLFGIPTVAQSQSVLRGHINDPVGRSVSNAKVVVLQDGKEIAHSMSTADGAFELNVPQGGRYDLRVEAEGFAPAALPAVFVAT